MIGCKYDFNFAGTTANATDSSSAAATSEAERENKTTDDDDKGEFIKLTCLKNIHPLVKLPDIFDCLSSRCLVVYCNATHCNLTCFFSEDKAAQSLLNKLIRSNLVQNTNQVEVLQKDPNSPLYSVKSFEELRLSVNNLYNICIEV